MPQISAPLIGSLSDLVRGIPFLQELILERTVFEFTRVSTGCDDLTLTGGYVSNVLANLNARMRLVLSKMYATIVLKEMNASSNLVLSAYFNPTGIRCLIREYCAGEQEVAKDIIQRFNTELKLDTVHVAEIGVHLGNWSLNLVRHFPNVIMLAVDPYNCSQDCYPETKYAYEALHAQAADVRDRYVQIHQMSDVASRWVGNRTLDLVYIDARHRYEDCKSDVENWVPKLKDTGILMFHDYYLHTPGVIQCIHEAFEEYGTGPLFLGMQFVAHFRLRRNSKFMKQ
eukprot:TRINITY_DN22771_c0_g1_i2.p1 TRINITY_DN22771_c0_g1~~TRINITY_DN22771_c0_g1_i2.p1  ORF type:complete len:285 (-),score=27.86 TRINITY_DN22771_c0_g1_i2:22-876(-)